MVNIKDNKVFLSRNCRLIVAPWKFDVLKTTIFALEASVLGQIFVLSIDIRDAITDDG